MGDERGKQMWSGEHREEAEKQSWGNEENERGKHMKLEGTSHETPPPHTHTHTHNILAYCTCVLKSHYLNYHSFMRRTSIITVWMREVGILKCRGLEAPLNKEESI